MCFTKTMNDISVFLQERLNGYQFPVYSTESCPRNKIEWLQRSSVLNCTEWNSYMCMPNENLTMLLEFCYKHPNIFIERGKKEKTIKVFHHIDKNSLWLFKSYTWKIIYWCFFNFKSSFFSNIKCAIQCVLGFFIIFLIAFWFSWLIWL